MSAGAGRRYGGKTPEERREQRRTQFLDAGLELFGTAGERATTIEAICAKAKLNPRYFYEQFATRDELLGQVYDRHVNDVLSNVRKTLRNAPPGPRERLEAGLKAFIHGSLSDERAARVNYFEVVGVSRMLDERRREVLARYADLVAGEFAQLPQFADRAEQDRRLAAVALVGATDALIIDRLTQDGNTSVEALIATLVHLFAPPEAKPADDIEPTVP